MTGLPRQPKGFLAMTKKDAGLVAEDIAEIL